MPRRGTLPEHAAPRFNVDSFLAFSYSMLQGDRGDFYDEQVFRHFLSFERKRAEHAKRPLLMVLVSLHNGIGRGSVISPFAAVRIVSCLARSVREVDVIGWYRQSRVAGAVLVQGPGRSADVLPRVKERLSQAVCSRLPHHIRGAVRVRVARLNRMRASDAA